jgi:hypothetical protein
MARNRPLKVFQAQFGFYDTVVAAPSQAAALRAWGVHQNLFTDGQARISDDARAVEAALAHPETPLRRALGSREAFSLAPGGLPIIPDAPKKPGVRARKASAEQRKPPADRSALDACEAALKALDDARTREEAGFRRRRDDLDADIAAAQIAYVRARKVASADLLTAADAYRAAGGGD